MKNPTDAHTLKPIGKSERQLLMHLFNLKERFNVRAYARDNNTNRSNIYDDLNKLERLGFVERGLANNKITEKGKIYLNSTLSEECRTSRQECRTEKENLSTHWHKFNLKIIKRNDNWEAKINSLGKIRINQIPNLKQHFIYLDSITIILNPKVAIISLYDILTANVDDADIQSFSKLIKVVEQLKEAGIILEGVSLEKGHWARVSSVFSEALNKINNRYYLDFGDGYHFWIDHSTGKSEDETDDKRFREILDKDLIDLRNNESYLRSDTKLMLDKLANVSKDLVISNTEYKPMFREMNDNLLKFSNAMMFYGEHFKSHAGLIKEGTKMLKKINQKKVSDWL